MPISFAEWQYQDSVNELTGAGVRDRSEMYTEFVLFPCLSLKRLAKMSVGTLFLYRLENTLPVQASPCAAPRQADTDQ